MARTWLRGLEIAGIQIGIEVPESCSWQWPAEKLADYQCLPRKPEVNVGVRVGVVDSADLEGERYSLGAWTFEVARRGDDWVLGLSRAGRREQIAFFDRHFRSGEIVLTRDVAQQGFFPLRSPLDEWIVLNRTVANGGLCLNATAIRQPGGVRVVLGDVDSVSTKGWQTPDTTLLGRNTIWLREVEGRLSVYRTPWGDAMDRSLGLVSRVTEIVAIEESGNRYHELLDPSEAAESLVTQAVVPVCDEGLFEQVLRNARHIGGAARMLRVGVTREISPTTDRRSPEFQSGFAPPR